jgi:hypothetical protein
MSYETHPQLPDIEAPDAVLRRYVDLYKWLDMLQTSELRLTRADQMEDRWEGSYSEVNLVQRPWSTPMGLPGTSRRWTTATWVISKAHCSSGRP